MNSVKGQYPSLCKLELLEHRNLPNTTKYHPILATSLRLVIVNVKSAEARGRGMDDLEK